ncbi:MAG: NAD(P)/FAD-dependent oxidoreductase, partial [Candidatus Aenigmatarchaeota archaeon]
MPREVDYDIIVAGSGPAGGQFARTIAENTDYTLAILERDSCVGDNDKSTAGSFKEVVEYREIPDHVVMDKNENVIFESPNETAELPISNYVLDFPALQEFLVSEAEKNGGELYTNATVTKPLVENGRVAGLEYL